MKNRLNLLIFVAFIIFAIIYIINYKVKGDKFYIKLNGEYPNLIIEDSLNAKIENVYEIPIDHRWNRYVVRVTTSDTKKIRIETSKCLNKKDTYLEYELHVGDSIKKSADSDTLLVINNNGKYFFKLKKRK